MKYKLIIILIFSISLGWFLHCVWNTYNDATNLKRLLNNDVEIEMQNCLWEYNNNEQRIITSLDDFKKCINNYGTKNLKELIFLNHNKFSIEISGEIIKIYRNINDRFCNTLFYRSIDNCNRQENYCLIATILNTYNYFDKKGITKANDTLLTAKMRSVNKLVNEIANKFVLNNKDYYIYNNIVLVNLILDTVSMNYEHKVERVLNYEEERYIVNLKIDLDSILKEYALTSITLKVDIPYYSPSPPPNVW